MQLRAYRPADCAATLALFTNTVRKVNAADYTWLHGTADAVRWGQSQLLHHTLVATEADQLVGFGDMDDTGYLDRLFVHHLFLHRGIATALVAKLELYARSHDILQATTHASITTKPFFEQRGYVVVTAQQVVRQGMLYKIMSCKKSCHRCQKAKLHPHKIKEADTFEKKPDSQPCNEP